MIQEILAAKTSFVIAGPGYAQRVAGESLGLAQLRVKTLTGLTSLEAAHKVMIQTFLFGVEQKRDFAAITEWITFHASLTLFLVLDVRNVLSRNIEWWLDSLEVLRRQEARLVLFTSFDQHARDLLFGSAFLSRSTFLGSFL